MDSDLKIKLTPAEEKGFTQALKSGILKELYYQNLLSDFQLDHLIALQDKANR